MLLLGLIFPQPALHAQTTYAVPFTFTTIAGAAGNAGSTDGAGSSARFNLPMGLVVDSTGNVFVADTSNHAIRKITTDGAVSTFAGLPGHSGASDGAGSAARFNRPRGIAVDRAGSVYVADTGNHTIRKISTEGTVSTIAGAAGLAGADNGTSGASRFNEPSGVAVDGAGTVYVADFSNHTIRRISPDGTVVMFAGSTGLPGLYDGTGGFAKFYNPFGLAVDTTGNLYVADAGNNRVRAVTPAGVVTTITSSIWRDANGNWGEYNAPSGVAVDGSGNVTFVDTKNNMVRRIPMRWTTVALAGTHIHGTSDGAGAAVGFFLPFGLAIDQTGQLYVADTYNHTIRKGVGPSLPVITTQPAAASTEKAGSARFSVVVTSQLAVNYWWQASSDNGSTWSFLNNDGACAGVSTSMLTLSNTTLAMDGWQYRCIVTSAVGSVSTAPATLAVGAARLINLSTRARVGTDAEMLIPGFVLSGAPKRVLIRAVGPSLEPYGISDYLPDPRLELKTLSGTPVATNDNWNAADAPAMTQVGAFSLPASSKDSALVVTLQPGLYTAAMSDTAGRKGVGLVELYDLEPNSGKLINISTRARVGTGSEVLIPGVVVDGSAKKRLLIRAAGPALQPYGINDFLADPQMEIKTLAGATVTTNDNWNSTDATLTAAFTTAGAFAFTAGSKDSALVVELDPGLYTVVVKGVADTTGIALVEVYELP